jgi:hypothetical protein
MFTHNLTQSTLTFAVFALKHPPTIARLSNRTVLGKLGDHREETIKSEIERNRSIDGL